VTLKDVLEKIMNAEGEERQNLSIQYAEVLTSQEAAGVGLRRCEVAQHRVSTLEAALAVVRNAQEDTE